MAKKVEVIIDGKETVSDAADKAEGGLRGFLSKAGSLIGGLAALGVGAALGGFFKKAIEESLEGEQSMARLREAVGSTGASFNAMRPEIESTVGNLMRLSTFTDDELNAALADMSLMTGDAKGSLANLGVAADLAAAKNIPLEQAAKAVGMAMEGNTKALTKLIPELKGSGDIIGDLKLKVDGTAQAMGETFAGSLTRAKNQMGEFAQAVGDAILGSDALTGSGNLLVDALAGMAKWAEENSEQIGKVVDAVVTTAKNIGDALIPVIRLLWTVAKPVFVALLGVITEASFAVRAGVIAYQEYAGNVAQIIGGLVEKAGGVLKAFGIDVVAGFGTTLKQWGEKLDKDASTSWAKLDTDFKAFHTRIKSTGDKAVTDVETQERTKVKHITEGLVDAEDATKDSIARQKAMFKLLDDNVAGYRRTLESLRPAVKAAMETQDVDAFNTTMKSAKETADKLMVKIREDLEKFREEMGVKTPPAIGKTTEALTAAELEAQRYREQLEFAFNAIDIADTVLGVADSFDVVNDKTAAVLGDVIGIADGIARIYAGDVAGGAAGIIGSLGSMIAALENPENRRLSQENTDALRRLRTELSALDLKIDGNEFEKVQNFLSGFISTMKTGTLKDLADFNQRMMDAGMTKGDIDRVAKELGIEIYDKNGVASLERLQQLLDALNGTMLGSVGNNFDTQFEMFKRTQRLQGNDGTMGGLSGMLDFLRNVGGVQALDGIDLNDPEAARKALVDLFVKMQNGGIGAEGLGDLTGRQFADIIEELIRGIDTATPSDGPLTGPVIRAGNGTASPNLPNTGSLVGDAGTNPVTIPSKTLDDVVATIGAQMSDFGKWHREDAVFFERIANATEATASNTAAALDYLAVMAFNAGGRADEARQLAAERRLAGNPSL